MIDGFRIDVTSQELEGLLDSRIRQHQDLADDCERRRCRLEGRPLDPASDDTDEQLAAAWAAFPEELARRAQRHRDRAEALSFVREHVITGEVYRLGRGDLCLLKIWPLGEGSEHAGEHDED